MDGVCLDFRKAEEAMMRLRLAIGRGALMVEILKNVGKAPATSPVSYFGSPSPM